MPETTAPRREDFRFFDRTRVRWAEVDMQKIVFNGHYLMYFDTAVAAYWRTLALPYHETMHGLQGDLYVRKATLEYEGSARYDDACDVGLRCARIGNSSMIFRAAVFRGEQRLVHGELVYVFADPATQTSRPVPPSLRAALDRFEAGGAMLDVETAPWAGLATETTALRQAVWAEELGLPEAAAPDAADASATHVLARNRFGLAVGCGRLVQGDGRIGEIGRMTVLQAVRGAGVGRALLEALVAEARRQRLQTLRLQAQRSAVGFYTRAGFSVANAEPLVLAGVPHVPMGLRLG
jgi:YbgC/YbaW family acyl-CoA thioester hydrolase